jgi:hypothetical protein
MRRPLYGGVEVAANSGISVALEGRVGVLETYVTTLQTETRSVALGGTGATSLTSGSYLKGAGTSAITAQAGIPAGDITSGTLDVARGGTGAVTGSGLVSIIPSSVSVSSGSASVNANGTVTFSGATSVNLDGVFTSSYKIYRIVILSTTNVATTALIRLRAGGTSATAAAYNQAGFSSNSSGLTAFNATALAYFILFDTYAGIETGATLDIYNPQTTQQTTATGLSVGVPGGTVRSTSPNLYHSTGASYDGFSLLTNNSYTLSGTLLVYGYRQ